MNELRIKQSLYEKFKTFYDYNNYVDYCIDSLPKE